MKITLLTLALVPTIFFSGIRGLRAEVGGEISSRPCPFDCATLGMKPDRCRDWREGETCFVEDTLVPDTALKAAPSATRLRQMEKVREISSCSERHFTLPSPRIAISEWQRSGNTLTSEVKVRGYIEGRCISEAGYYENGQLKERISFTEKPERTRFPFILKGSLSPADKPEVRATNRNGEARRVLLDHLDQR